MLVALVGCASGKQALSGGGDLGISDRATFEAYMWPDQGPVPDVPRFPDTLSHDFGQSWDLGVDLSRDLWVPTPDQGTVDSAPPACADTYEPNQSCAAHRSLGSTRESASWISRRATIHPGTDVDWFRAVGEEGSHTCLPFTNQTYYFKVRVTVPTGRELRVCLRKGSCSGFPTCATNLGTPGPTQLNVTYKVNGTCAINDDTTAYIKVEAADGKGGCDEYTVAFNYND